MHGVDTSIFVNWPRYGIVVSLKNTQYLRLSHVHLNTARQSSNHEIQSAPLLVDSRLLLSYNHLLLSPVFTRLPPMGDGVAGIKLDSLNGELRPSGEEDPKEDPKDDSKLGLRLLSLPPFDTAL